MGYHLTKSIYSNIIILFRVNSCYVLFIDHLLKRAVAETVKKKVYAKSRPT